MQLSVYVARSNELFAILFVPATKKMNVLILGYRCQNLLETSKFLSGHFFHLCASLARSLLILFRPEIKLKKLTSYFESSNFRIHPQYGTMVILHMFRTMRLMMIMTGMLLAKRRTGRGTPPKLKLKSPSSTASPSQPCRAGRIHFGKALYPTQHVSLTRTGTASRAVGRALIASFGTLWHRTTHG